MHSRWTDLPHITKTLVQVASLICAWVSIFRSRSDWDFQTWESWGTSILLFFIFVCLVLVIWDYFRDKSGIRIFDDKGSFFNFMKNARASASVSILNFGGDVSWLKREKADYFKLKKDNPNLKITGYYNESEITEETKSWIEEYGKHNIRMQPYPISDFPNLKGMITDIGRKEDSKMYLIHRHGKNENGYCVSLHKDGDVALKFARSFLLRLPILRKKNNYRYFRGK